MIANTLPKTDSYGEFQNDITTYQFISHSLKVNGSVIVGWTDGNGTHYDILFSIPAGFPEFNTLQGGLFSTYLFVSIMRVGAFGFKIAEDPTIDSSYYAEKLGLPIHFTAGAVAELVNGVRADLWKGL